MEWYKSIYFVSICLIFFNQMAWFIIASLKKDNGIADVGWGFGFLLVAVFQYIQNDRFPNLLLLILVSVWAIRLSGHIFLRNRLHQTEDWRYKAWREEWGRHYLIRAFLKVFMLQGFFLYIISLPIQYAWFLTGVEANIWSWVGLLLFSFGLFWETIADAQLYRFKKEPKNKGKFLQSGLWNLSRHPNYFGEIVLWWGITLFVYAQDFGAWFIWASPITITLLIVKVSGVAMLERKQKQQDGFNRFQEGRPALIPNFKFLFQSVDK